MKHLLYWKDTSDPDYLVRKLVSIDRPDVSVIVIYKFIGVNEYSKYWYFNNLSFCDVNKNLIKLADPGSFVTEESIRRYAESTVKAFGYTVVCDKIRNMA